MRWLRVCSFGWYALTLTLSRRAGEGMFVADGVVAVMGLLRLWFRWFGWCAPRPFSPGSPSPPVPPLPRIKSGAGSSPLARRGEGKLVDWLVLLW